MRAVADAVPLLHHKDVRHLLNGAHPLGDHDGRRTAVVLKNRFAQGGVRLVIQRRR